MTENKIKIAKDGIPMLCVDEVHVNEKGKKTIIDLTLTNTFFGCGSWTFEYNPKTEKWEEVDNDLL